MRPVRAKALIINAFALAGRLAFINPYTQGGCPGLCAYWAFSPSLTTLLVFPDSNNSKYLKNLKCSAVLKRSPFGLQNESFWWAKGVLLKCKRTTIGRQKESFWNFEFWVLNFELFSATPAILNYSILNWCRWEFWILSFEFWIVLGYVCDFELFNFELV